jgi:hypothetical protein
MKIKEDKKNDVAGVQATARSRKIEKSSRNSNSREIIVRWLRIAEVPPMRSSKQGVAVVGREREKAPDKVVGVLPGGDEGT